MANRNKLLELFISNIANAIIHKILEKAIDKPDISEKYNKESDILRPLKVFCLAKNPRFARRTAS